MEVWECGGLGFYDSEDEDADLDDAGDECETCQGYGGWHRCLSSNEWCLSNPLPGRGGVERGQLEWFTVEEPC